MASPSILCLIMTSFVYFEWDQISFATIAENLALISKWSEILVKIIIWGNLRAPAAYARKRNKLWRAPTKPLCAERSFLLSCKCSISRLCCTRENVLLRVQKANSKIITRQVTLENKTVSLNAGDFRSFCSFLQVLHCLLLFWIQPSYCNSLSKMTNIL